MLKKVYTIIITSIVLYGCSDSNQMKTLGERRHNLLVGRAKLGLSEVAAAQR